MPNRASDLFGSANRADALVAIRLLGSTYPAELAAMLRLRLWAVQRIRRTGKPRLPRTRFTASQ